jgi:hypothetical protein
LSLPHRFLEVAVTPRSGQRVESLPTEVCHDIDWLQPDARYSRFSSTPVTVGSRQAPKQR